MKEVLLIGLAIGMIGFSIWELFSMIREDDPELNNFMDED